MIPEWNSFINGDCMEYLKEFPDNYFSLALVDPPYGLLEAGMQTGGEKGLFQERAFSRKNIGSWDKAPKQEYFDELFRVSKNQIIWGGNYFNLPPCRCFVIWDKMQPWENFSRCEYAWTSFKKPAKLFQQDNRYSGKIHPTQKSVELYLYLLGQFAEDGDTILDTHVGSASSLIACHRTNHKYIGFEVDETYYAKAKERLERETAQTNIFQMLEQMEINDLK